jgi:hypothetical protein
MDEDDRSSRKKIASHLLRVCIKGLESKRSVTILERSLLLLYYLENPKTYGKNERNINVSSSFLYNFHSEQFSYNKYLANYTVYSLERRTETYIGLHVKCTLSLLKNNRIWNMTANFIETLQCQIP